MAENHDEIALLPGQARELRRIEFKGPGSATDKHLFAKVTRAALSMGNSRDGGYVVVGIDDDKVGALEPGLTEPDLASWLQRDDVARRLAAYSDPPLNFEIAEQTLESGAKVAVLQVFEFEELPHLCAKSYVVPGRGKDKEVLREGALYVRTRKLPETAEVGSSAEMREVIDLATEKALRRLLARIGGAGGEIVPREREADSREKFDEQRQKGWT